MKSAVIWAIGVCFTGALAAAACGRYAEETSEKEFLRSLGQTSITVFPAYIRQHKSSSYDSAAAASIAAFLRNEGFAEAVLSNEKVPISGAFRVNQSRMFRETSREFASYLRVNPIQTRYALITEYLMTGNEGVGGVHCYVIRKDGMRAFGVLLNSHHKSFAQAAPFLLRSSVGEGALLVAEELRFHESLRNGCAVDRKERTVPAIRLVMNRMGDQVLSGATLALDQNGRSLAASNFLYQLANFLDVLRNPNNLLYAEFAAPDFLGSGYFGAEPARFQRVAEDVLQFLEIDRLFDEIISPEPESLDGIVDHTESRDHYHRNGYLPVTKLRQNLDSGHVRQLHVERYEVGIVNLNSSQSRCAILRQADMVAPLLQFLLQGPAHQAFIVYYQDCFFWH